MWFCCILQDVGRNLEFTFTCKQFTNTEVNIEIIFSVYQTSEISLTNGPRIYRRKIKKSFSKRGNYFVSTTGTARKNQITISGHRPKTLVTQRGRFSFDQKFMFELPEIPVVNEPAISGGGCSGLRFFRNLNHGCDIVVFFKPAGCVFLAFWS